MLKERKMVRTSPAHRNNHLIINLIVQCYEERTRKTSDFSKKKRFPSNCRPGNAVRGNAAGHELVELRRRPGENGDLGREGQGVAGSARFD